MREKKIVSKESNINEGVQLEMKSMQKLQQSYLFMNVIRKIV